MYKMCLHLLQGCGGGVAEVHGLVDDELVLLAVRSCDVVIRGRGQARLQHRLRALLNKDEKDVKKLVVKIDNPSPEVCRWQQLV